MKLGIVTVFKGENVGCFFQAWALKNKLNDLGEEASFVNYYPVRKTWNDLFISVAKCCAKFRFYRASQLVERRLVYQRLRKKTGVYSNSNTNFDALVYGSDTVWNFADPFFARKAKFFSGQGVKIPKYSYAASADSTTLEEFTKYPAACEAIKEFRVIAVRDEQTQRLVEAIGYPGEIVRTNDPTLFYTKEKYITDFYPTGEKAEKVFLIYYFGPIPDATEQQIEAFAREKGLKIIRLGLPEKKNDSYLLPDPEIFIKYYADAEYVFTNTFHGCVFSIIFQKQFATDVKNRKKVLDVMAHFGLEERVMRDGVSVADIYDRTTIDHAAVESLLNEDRTASEHYLRSIIAAQGESS